MPTFYRSFALAAVVSTLSIATAQTQTAPVASTPAVEAPTQNTADRAWSLLTDTVTQSGHTDQRIQALAALGIMGSNTRAANLITIALTDKDLDVRSAAILAAGQTKNPVLFPQLRKALDDAEPQVAYTAAVTLWKMHDYTGEDLLLAVANGERRAGPTLFKGARHSAARTLHDPTAMATLGAQESAGLLLGPFGIGIAAVEYARKNGGDSARATAIDLLAQQHTQAIREALIDALDDKDPIVRAASAKALVQWPTISTAAVLVPLLDDAKLPVRLTAAAAYLSTMNPARSKTAKSK